jgi:hypothetical protein
MWVFELNSSFALLQIRLTLDTIAAMHNLYLSDQLRNLHSPERIQYY